MGRRPSSQGNAPCPRQRRHPKLGCPKKTVEVKGRSCSLIALMLGTMEICMTKINTWVLILVFTVSLAANSSLFGTYYFAGDDYFQFDKSITDWFATRGIWRIVGIPLPG